ACRFDGELFGIQFEADIEHLVYYTGTLEEAPAAWADLFTEPISYTFPAAGVGGLVNDTFLIQYLAQGGRLLDEEGNPAVEEASVQRVLRFYDALREWQVSPPGVLEMGSLEDCWKAYTGGNITVSHISSWQYLTSRPLMRDTDFAAVPTETGLPATMSRGWAFVIVSRSPQRQQAAADLIEWLMSPESLAQWSEAANHLPARGSAISLVGWPNDYEQFLEGQLQRAFYRPSGTQFQRIARALQVAVEDVLTEESTPREATAQLMASLE
ncbi:MAG: extracellular solute-binding protein, partial [Anaerolineae bacterium]|nr:extracellular solute-binding protein [Anaerolineae bacterium]